MKRLNLSFFKVFSYNTSLSELFQLPRRLTGVFVADVRTDAFELRRLMDLPPAALFASIVSIIDSSI